MVSPSIGVRFVPLIRISQEALIFPEFFEFFYLMV